MIKLGDKVKDTITDFGGMAVARCVYLNGCVRIEMRPKGLDKDGNIVEAIWIDESQLEKHRNRRRRNSAWWAWYSTLDINTHPINQKAIRKLLNLLQ